MNGNRRKTLQGFTLVEILVVIAIIGILSAAVLSILRGPKVKARVSSASSTMHTLQLGLQYCAQENYTVTAPTQSNNGGGGQMCTTGVSYTQLPSGWVYCDGTADAACNAVSNATQVSAAGDGKIITCTEMSCTVT